MAVNRLRHVPNTNKVRVTFDPVPANSSSGRLSFETNVLEGVLQVVRYHTGTLLTTNFRIFANASSLAGTVDNIISVEDVAQCSQRTNLGVDYENTDNPQTTLLYLEVDNQSLVAPTGTITLELMIKTGGTR